MTTRCQPRKLAASTPRGTPPLACTGTSMSHFLLKFFYYWALPPGCIIVALALLTWFARGTRLWVRLGMGLTTLVLYVSSLGPVGWGLIDRLENWYPRADPSKADVILMLGSGVSTTVQDMKEQAVLTPETTYRLFAVARLHKMTGLPILLSGGSSPNNLALSEAAVAKRYLQDMGISEQVIRVEPASMTTKENILFSKVILAEHGYKHPLLVTSGFHMPRGMEICRQAGIEALPYPLEMVGTDDGSTPVYMNTVPNSWGAWATATALREMLGLLDLKLRGL